MKRSNRVTSKYINSGFMDGRTYIIGRAGQLRIDDSSVSRSHADIKFVDGMIKIRDLCSTNGTFVENGSKFVPCHEAYISPNTRIKFGAVVYSLKGLLAASGINAISQDDTVFTIILSKPSRKQAGVMWGRRTNSGQIYSSQITARNFHNSVSLLMNAFIRPFVKLYSSVSNWPKIAACNKYLSICYWVDWWASQRSPGSWQDDSLRSVWCHNYVVSAV